METKPHIGRKIARIRELRGMKQEALAQAMGVSQQTISNLENSEELEESRLFDVAKALGVSVEAVRAFSEEGVINYFNSFNNFNDGSVSTFNSHCNFNPIDKLIEAHEENRKLYERLIEELRRR